MLSSSARRLLWINGLYTLANGLSGLFTNVYLWRLKPGVTTPAYFNLWQMATILIMMPLLGGVAKRWGAVIINAAGMALYAGFYLTLLLLRGQAANYLPLLGMFIGLALSCYAMATHTLAYDLTDESNREFYYNRNGFYTSFAGLIAPLTAGWVVSSLAGLTGYQVVFVTSFVLFTAAAVLGSGLSAPRKAAPYRIGEVLPGKHPGWHRLLIAYLLVGTQNGVFSFAVNLLVFLATGGERSVGNFAFVTSVVGMGAYWITGRYMNAGNRHRFFPVGAVLMGLATAVIGLGATWGVMLASGLLNALAQPFWQTAYSSTAFDVIKAASGNRDLRTEMIGAREIPLNLGRIAGLWLVVQYAPTNGGTGFLRGLLACLGLAFPLAWLFFRAATRTLAQAAGAENRLSGRNSLAAGRKGSA